MFVNKCCRCIVSSAMNDREVGAKVAVERMITNKKGLVCATKLY